jgi:hypothetical protein
MLFPKNPLIPSLLLAAPAFAGEGALPSSLEPLFQADPIAASVGLQVTSDGLIGGAASYEGRFDARGVTYVPALGSRAPVAQTLRFEALELAHGSVRVGLLADVPHVEERTAVYERGSGVTERYGVTREGLWQSFTVSAPPAGFGASGDLVVRGRLSGVLAGLGRPHAGGLRFDGAFGGIEMGGLTGIDALGRTVQGELAIEGDILSLTLPESFVAAAAWPIVFDPLLGTTFTADGSVNDDSEPDVAFDASNGRHLIVWKRTFSASNSDIRGQRVLQTGALDGGTLFFNSAGVVTRPRVADANHASRFAVAWSQTDGGFDTVHVQLCDPATGALSSFTNIAHGAPGTYSAPDIGGEVLKNPYKQVVLVWDEDGVGIRAVKLNVEATGDWSVGSSIETLAFDSTLPLFLATVDAPTISRAAGNIGLYGIAYLRKPLLGNAEAYALIVDRDLNVVNPSTNLTSSSDSETFVDIDGGGIFDAQFVVGTVRTTSGGTSSVTATSITAGASTMQVGPTTTVSTGPTGTSCAVGWRPGKAYVAWIQSVVFFNQLQVKGIDPASCATCENPLTLGSILLGTSGFGLCMNSQGGNYDDPRGMIVWQEESPGTSTDQDIRGQLLEALGSGATSTNIGGGCGLGGTITNPVPPAVGNGFFSLQLTGADPAASVAILNINAPASPFACGPCQWVPFLLTFTVPVVGGAGGQFVPIPCNPSFVGQQVDAQWNVISPSATGCSLFPGGSLSDRLRLTFGI